MDTPPEALERAIEEAVELRLCGFTWDQVGARLQRSAETVRRWPIHYAACWQRLIEQGRAAHEGDAGDEALAVLRTLLRSRSDKVRHDAAKLLMQLRSAAKSAASTQANDAHLFMDYLLGLSHDDLRTFLGDELARYLDEPAGPPGGDPPGEGAGEPERVR